MNVTHPADSSPLLERDEELARLDEMARAASMGVPGVVLIEGAAGIGKTALLREAQRRAARSGLVVVAATGGLLERDFGFGVARQLFEPTIVGGSERDRAELLEGAATLARPVVLPADAISESGVDQGAVLHGLYWLTANLAARRSVLLTVDDVQWADRASLQFLLYLSRRLEGLPVAVVVAVRTGEPAVDAELLAEFASRPEVHVLRPGALTVHAVGAMVKTRLAAELEDGFVAACHTASGGVPFLVCELARVLADNGVQPTARSVDLVAEMGPRTVAQATSLRLSRLSPSAAAAAHAVAVLDRHARLDRIAALAGIDVAATRTVLDTMMKMELLAPGTPTRFIHPLVHRAVYDDIPPTALADGHQMAARLLAEEHAPPDEIAAHLLQTDPAGNTEVVPLLRNAARHAVTRGSPESAAAYLRRALREDPPAPEKATVLHELGNAERLTADPRAVGTLEEAIRLSDDTVTRARIAYHLADLYLLIGEWAKRIELLPAALAQLGDDDLDLAARLEAGRIATEINDPRYAHEFETRLPRLRQLLEKAGPGARNLAIPVASAMMMRWPHHGEVVDLVQRGLDGGRLVRDEGSESQMVPMGIWTLICIDRLDEANAATEGVLDDARRRGSVYGYCTGCWLRGLLNVQRGELKKAEADYRTSLELAVQNGWTFVIPSLLNYGIDAFIERSQLGDLARLAETVQLNGDFAHSVPGAFQLNARGRLRLARGERAAAAGDLRAAGAIWTSVGCRNPLAAPWRSSLALAIHSDNPDEAQQLVREELVDATALGLTRCQGVALRAAGLVAGRPEGIELLEESRRALEECPSTLEQARSEIELGAALRRSDYRSAAREHLRIGLGHAHQSGAEGLARRATGELRIAGGRPRRETVVGPDSLTASEDRVARMAADGMPNRAIAQALFVSAKTVENQLGSVYRKLGVSSRARLLDVLVVNTS